MLRLTGESMRRVALRNIKQYFESMETFEERMASFKQKYGVAMDDTTKSIYKDGLIHETDAMITFANALDLLTDDEYAKFMRVVRVARSGEEAVKALEVEKASKALSE